MGGDRSLAPAGVPRSTPWDNQSLSGHMRLTVRRVVGIGAAAVVTAIAGLAVLVYFVVSDMCGNEVLSEFASPEGTKKLVVYERTCGATSRYSTHASLLGSEGRG